MPKKNICTAIFLLMGVASCVTTLIGGWIHYSPVPIYDMWFAVEMFSRTQALHWHDWWMQHNEHRIILARALFWIDFHWFTGNAAFLVTINYLLLFWLFLVLLQFLHAKVPDEQYKVARWMLQSFVACIVFSWLQYENLIAPFQSQFLLAYLLPLAGLYWLYRAASSVQHSTRYFIFALMIGVLALGAMANGVLALPLMTVMAVLTRMPKDRVITLLLLSIVGVGGYFYQYHAPPGSVSLLSAIQNQPRAFLAYFLLYLGGPVYLLFEKANVLIGQSAGFFLLLSVCCFGLRAIRQTQISQLDFALLLFLLYVCAAATATAGARLNFGLHYAVSSRYLTPTLLAWAVLLILYAPQLLKPLQNYAWQYLLPIFAVMLLFLVQQRGSWREESAVFFEHKIAALALKMGVYDKAQIEPIFPDVPSLQRMSKAAIAKNLSVFNDAQLKNVSVLDAQTETLPSTKVCLGQVDAHRLTDDLRYVQVTGVLLDRDSQTLPETIHILDAHNTVVGYAITGLPKKDLGHQEATLGFKGYLLSKYVGKPLVLHEVETDCGLSVKLPETITDKYERLLAVLANKLQIRDPQQSVVGEYVLGKIPAVVEDQYTQAWTLIQQSTEHLLSAPFEHICSASINEYTAINEDTAYVRFNGQISYARNVSLPDVIRLVDNNQHLVGLGISDALPEVKTQTAVSFRGYILRAVLTQSITIEGLQSKCSYLMSTGVPPFKSLPVSLHQNPRLLSQADIVSQHWLGSDRQKTHFDGYWVTGSYMNSDSDVGDITLNLQRGAAFCYRSGAKGGRQLLIVDGKKSAPIVLPVATNWIELQFTGAELPKNFNVQLIDQGTEEGEWSAIGLKN